MGLRRNGADARPTATVRNAEGLVQVQVRDVAAEFTRLRYFEERVEVGAIDVHLTASIVHELRDRANLGFVHAVGRRIRDHDAREFIGVILDLLLEVVKVHVAVGIARNDHDAQAREHRGGSVRPVR